jgi:hypothetical protein
MGVPIHPQSAKSASIHNLAWMQGAWHGTFGDDSIEEHWSAAAASTMMGMFRWIRAGSVRFFELMTIDEEAGALVMRIKHFDSGLKGWEDKDECVTLDLVQLEGGGAVWSKRGDETGRWLLYERTGDHMHAWFETSGQPAPPMEKRFLYDLSPSPAS